MSLEDAAFSLDELAAGRMPDRARLIAGALSLDTLRREGKATGLLSDASAGLEMLVSGGTLDLDQSGRERAAEMAMQVRRLAAIPPR